MIAKPSMGTVKVELIPATAAMMPREVDALRAIKARRRKGDPIQCCGCSGSVNGRAFVIVLATPTEGSEASGALCAKCGPTLEAARLKVKRILRGMFPRLAQCDLTTTDAPP